MDKEEIPVFIDTSSLIYGACFNSNKKEKEYNNFDIYLDALMSYIKNILTDTKATSYILFGDGYTSFRKKRYTDFKGDRKSKPTPKFFTDLKHYAVETLGMITSNIFEADDLCLLHNRKYGGIVASGDSDLRQDKGTFFNYNYHRYNIPLEVAFEELTSDKAEKNLWKQVMKKGHNNKTSYLVGCGEETAKGYLKAFTPAQAKLAAMNAFVFGIDKSKYEDVKRNIKGYGLSVGIREFYNAFSQSYLLRTEEEALELDPEFYFEFPTSVDIFNKHYETAYGQQDLQSIL